MAFARSLIAAAALASALPAFAVNTATLTFDEPALAGYYNPVGNAYEAEGAVFDANALVLSNDALGTYYSNAPSMGGVLVVDPLAASSTLNAASGKGFVNQISFWYSASADVVPAVSLYAGADGTGKRLLKIALLDNVTDSGCSDSAACAWNKATYTFTGTASSVVFSSGAGAVAYDNITISTVPEPESYALMLAGLATVGLLASRRRQR